MPRKKQKPSLSPEEVKNIISTDESDNLEELTTSHEESDTAEIKKTLYRWGSQLHGPQCGSVWHRAGRKLLVGSISFTR
ncbi:hypothetical protein LRY64_01080 [Candidatus Woesebacteria bacterium]|nr:hypothetical protein [Candidatus Woesebacteria bacterium]